MIHTALHIALNVLGLFTCSVDYDVSNPSDAGHEIENQGGDQGNGLDTDDAHKVA